MATPPLTGERGPPRALPHATRRSPIAVVAVAAAVVVASVWWIDRRGVAVVAATPRLEPIGWGLATEIDGGEARQTFGRPAWQTAVAGALVVVAFTGFVLAAWRWQHARWLAAELARERAVRDAQERYRLLSEYAHDVVLFVADDGRILEANRAAAAAYGYSREDLLGLTIDDLCVTKGDAVSEHGAHTDGLVYETVHRRRDGSPFPVEVSAVGAAIGGARVLVAIVRDITERKENEERLRRLFDELEERVRRRTAELHALNQELEAFTYSVSHDLRAPLRHIEGFVRILEEDWAAQFPSEAQHCLRRIRAGCERMALLTDALLRLSRVGRAELQPRPVRVDAIARAAFDELRASVGERAIEFVIGELPSVSADPALVRQLVNNLIANALKFTRSVPAPRIEVGADLRGDMPVFYVRDNGVGFDVRYAGKLFGVFQRLHGYDEFEGTGIGLSIVKRIVEKHGGRVWAESAPSGGATFYFTLAPA